MFRKSKGGAKFFDKNAYYLGQLQTIKERTITVLTEFLADPTTKTTALEKIEALTRQLNEIAVDLALNM
jgi:hypothetical protein